MQYLVLVYVDEDAERSAQTPSAQDWDDYTASLQEAGVYVAGEALRPTGTAHTLRKRAGDIVVSDGPFAETKEQLAGYYIIDCASEEDALGHAARCPSVEEGCAELRPVMEMPS